MAIAEQLMVGYALEKRLLVTEPGKPRTDNNEYEVEQLLIERHLEPLYERFAYPLPTGFQFQPDFWIPTCGRRPEFHVEVTILDRIITRAEKRLRSADSYKLSARETNELVARRDYFKARLDRKRRKIVMTEERYGIKTVLITDAHFALILVDPSELDRLLKPAVGLRAA